MSLFFTAGLLLAGALLEPITFTATVADDAAGCDRSYTLSTFGNAIITDFFLHENDARPGRGL